MERLNNDIIEVYQRWFDETHEIIMDRATRFQLEMVTRRRNRRLRPKWMMAEFIRDSHRPFIIYPELLKGLKDYDPYKSQRGISKDRMLIYLLEQGIITTSQMLTYMQDKHVTVSDIGEKYNKYLK